jgi:nucleotide-binding universal stress UspA family protein
MTVQAPATVTFERIFIPTDFSDLSMRSLEYGKSIARRYNSRIMLVHVNLPINPIAPPEAVWVEQQDVWEKLEERLEEAGAALRADGLLAETISLTGNIDEELQSAIENYKADLIVMGTHGRHGLGRLLLGSETESLARRSKCPVMVVGPNVLAVPEKVWRLKNVICATALDPGEAWIAANAYTLAYDHKASFLLLHIERTQEKGRGGNWHDFEKIFQELLLPREMDPRYFLRTVASDESVEHEVFALASRRHADLIVLGAHSASGIADHLMRGTVPRVFAEAACPVLVLHQS